MNFDEIEIDETRYELRRNGQPVAVEPKVFDLIRYLAEHANRLVTKDELIEGVWDGRIVSDAALSSAIKAARRAMGDEDVASSRIRTVRGRGFRMEFAKENPPASPQSAPAPGADVFVQPSFVVLPVSGNLPEGVADVIQRRLSNAMARVPFVTVAAPALARRLGDASPDDLARALGRGFAMEISGSMTEQSLRLDCLLFDTSTGATLWTYETPLFEIETLNDAVTDIAIRLQPQLVRAVYGTLAAASDGQDPKVMTLQALGTMQLRGWNRPAFKEAEAILRDALSRDSSLAFAHGALALVLALGQEVGLAEPSPQQREEAINHADHAIELDGHSSLVLGFAGCALCDAGQGMRGKTLLERALLIDSGNPQALAALGTQLTREGETETGGEYLIQAIKTAPQDNTMAVWRSILAMNFLWRRELDQALEEARRAVAADDQTHLSRSVLAAVHVARGETAAAKAAWEDGLRVTPDLTADQIAGMIGRKLAAKLNAL